MGFSAYGSVQDGGNLPSFSPVPAEDKKLYTRNSFGGVYSNYRDSTMDSCDFPLHTPLTDTSRNDLTMSNLQDVMEENLFSSTQPLSSVPSVGPVGPVGSVGSVGPVGPVGPVGSVGSVGPVGPTLSSSTGPTSYFTGKDGPNPSEDEDPEFSPSYLLLHREGRTELGILILAGVRDGQSEVRVRRHDGATAELLVQRIHALLVR